MYTYSVFVFIGWVCTLPWVPRLADKYGRRRVFQFGMFCDLILLTAIFFTKNLNIMIGLAFLFGMCCTMRV